VQEPPVEVEVESEVDPVSLEGVSTPAVWTETIVAVVATTLTAAEGVPAAGCTSAEAVPAAGCTAAAAAVVVDPELAEESEFEGEESEVELEVDDELLELLPAETVPPLVERLTF